MSSTMREGVKLGGESAAGSALARPDGADEHRRALLAQLPAQLAHVLTEPLGPLGLAGATVQADDRRSRDSRTAQMLRDFAERTIDALPEWDFGRRA